MNAIGERAAVTFVGVAGNIFLLAFSVRNRLPFDAGGKPAPPRPRSPDVFMASMTACGPISKALQSHETLVRPEVVDRQRIDQSATPERPSVLVDQVGDFIDRADAPLVLAAAQKTSLEQARHIRRLDIAVGNALIVDNYLHHGLQPGRAPGTIANQFDVVPFFFGVTGNRNGDVVGADGHRLPFRAAHRFAFAISRPPSSAATISSNRFVADSTVSLAVDHDRRRTGAVAKAVNGFQRYMSLLSCISRPKDFLACADQFATAHRLAGLCLADLDDMFAGGRRCESHGSS